MNTGKPYRDQYGYGAAGASRTRRALKGMTDRSLSAREDIDLQNMTMRQRGRLLYMSTPIAASAINTSRTNVIGVGLKHKSRVNRAALGLTREEATAWEKNAEAEFSLWASDKRNCDAMSMNDFYGLQQLAYLSGLISGDCLVLIKRRETTGMSPYSLRLHIIEADRVSTPKSKTMSGSPIFWEKDGNPIFDGVEVDNSGGVVAYHICNKYPHQNRIGPEEKWTRVEAVGAETGLPNVLHLMNAERPEQYRGVTYLAPVIEPLLQLRRYTESEQNAALINSYLTAFIKSEAQPVNDNPMNETNPQDQVSYDPNEYELGSGNMLFLQPGEDVGIVESKHPNNGFRDFTRAMAEQMGAALELPADILLKAFDASYSASRAALLEAWKGFRMRREWFVSDFCRPVYETWLSEAVALGRIQAPGFFSDPILRAAWLGSEWIGPSQGQLDPVKEITALRMGVQNGFYTNEQATVLLCGGDWDQNMEQLAIEQKALAQLHADETEE